MTDRELLELAAKAAGYEYTSDDCTKEILLNIEGNYENYPWNPLTDDGDALRLAVKLQIDIGFWLDHASADNCISEKSHYEDYNGDPYAATRRAIVRAAAEIGKSND